MFASCLQDPSMVHLTSSVSLNHFSILMFGLILPPSPWLSHKRHVCAITFWIRRSSHDEYCDTLQISHSWWGGCQYPSPDASSTSCRVGSRLFNKRDTQSVSIKLQTQMTHFLSQTEPEKFLSFSTFVITPMTSRTPSRIIGLSSNFFSSSLLDFWTLDQPVDY